MGLGRAAAACVARRAPGVRPVSRAGVGEWGQCKLRAGAPGELTRSCGQEELLPSIPPVVGGGQKGGVGLGGGIWLYVMGVSCLRVLSLISITVVQSVQCGFQTVNLRQCSVRPYGVLGYRHCMRHFGDGATKFSCHITKLPEKLWPHANPNVRVDATNLV